MKKVPIFWHINSLQHATVFDRCQLTLNAEAEAPILWPSETKSWLIGKDADAGKDGRHEKKGVTGDEMVGWYNQLNEHESEPTLMLKDREAWHATVHKVAESDTT